ncbi:FAD-binding oxidoreductase [Acaryochloris marina]|uniref:Glycolate oxidase subunit n=1 Tax=Acaryochloris marina (strain MBIC 11017) TaxID=329726 RepID=B0C963_ACAM1|nr:FAD-binding oxidoreductase [Acaryochloris marina]ABW27744.1 glycolate oxidase subunit [Acaryochloris marina MBIC11017]BDM82474.1 glycolate oxidase [Acaryochloris marina MBIC10699]
MVLSTAAISQQLIPIVGPEQVLLLSEASLLSAPEQILDQGALPTYIVYPRTQAELAAVMAVAHQQRWRLLVCGHASKLHWGGLTQQIDLVVCTQGLQRVVAHATGDLTVTVEAGLSLATLQAKLAPFRQHVALDPAYAETATLGGLIATRDGGSLRHRYGSLRDMCIGITFIRADGQSTKAGGRVVKNVAGYDLMKLMTGAFGTLGVIAEVTLRLYPLPEVSQTVVIGGTEADITALTRILLKSTLTPMAVDLLSAAAIPSSTVEGELALAVRFQSVEESVVAQCDRMLKLAQGCSSCTLSGDLDTDFWQQLTQQFWQVPQPSALVCKFGVLPAQSTQFLAQFDRYCQQQQITGWGRIYAGSGTGVLRLEQEGIGKNPSPGVEWIRELRSHCQNAHGFLTVLDAPPVLKRSLDVWGYPGNALASMKQLKQQFDPHNILNPDRFVGGI